MKIRTYRKGRSTQLSTNFKSTEFDCKGEDCCTRTLIDPKLIQYLQNIREHFNASTTVLKGYICTDSNHNKGVAAEIRVKNTNPRDVAKYAEEIGIKNIKLYEEENYVYIDTREEKSFLLNGKEVDSFTKKETPIKLYSDENPPIVCMQTQGKCYRGTDKMTIKGILWHSTGANNPYLKRYVQPSDNATDREEMLNLLGVNKYKNDWNHSDRVAGMNAWIGKLADGTITSIQTMPWDFRPWGCGTGVKGSCNYGWIQFEICEDDMKNEEYFNAVYDEACKLTAYLCEKFNIDPYGSVVHNGIKVPTILCHYDSYKLKLGTNHGDIYTWFSKHDKDMDTVREDVSKLLPNYEKQEEKPVEEENVVEKFKVNDIVKLVDNATYYSGKTISPWVFKQEWIVSSVKGDRVVINKSTSTTSAINSPVHQDNLILVKRKEVVKKEYFYIRKNWEDVKSQIALYINKDNAIVACNKAGYGYSVFNSNGEKIYSAQQKENEDTKEEKSNKIEKGSEVKLTPGAKYSSGANIPDWVFKHKLYIRDIRDNGDFVISTQKTGSVTGVVPPSAVVLYDTDILTCSYVVRIIANALNVRQGPGTEYKINEVVRKNELYTIVAESGKWGKLKSGAGWISLEKYTKKM